jgi:TRAP-type C4-dicarboxylate transport system permease small subunit
MKPDVPVDHGWLGRACRAFEGVAMALVGVMTAFIVVQVVARNLFNEGLPWAEELARYSGLGVVYLAVPLLLLHDRHIKVDLFLSKARGRTAWAWKFVNEGLVVAFCLFFLWGGWLFLQRAARFSTAALGIPNWLYYLPAACGMLLLTLVAVSRLWRLFRGGPAP